MSNTCILKEPLNLKSFEKLFDSISLKLYEYARLVLMDDERAEKAVSSIYVSAFKIARCQNADEELFLKLLTTELLKESRENLYNFNFSSLEICFAYLFFKLKLKKEAVSSILSLRYEEMEDLKKSIREKISLAAGSK